MNYDAEAAEVLDRRKGYLSCSFMILAFVFPLIAFIFGTGRWDVETGATIAAGTFLVMMVTAVVIALTIEHLSWLFTFIPLLSSAVYTIAPDFIPGPAEDALVLGVGAFFTIILIVRKVAPVYLLLAVITTGLYAWFGRELIPGLIDELVLFLVVFVLGFIVYRNYGSGDTQPE